MITHHKKEKENFYQVDKFKLDFLYFISLKKVHLGQHLQDHIEEIPLDLFSHNEHQCIKTSRLIVRFNVQRL